MKNLSLSETLPGLHVDIAYRFLLLSFLLLTLTPQLVAQQISNKNQELSDPIEVLMHKIVDEKNTSVVLTEISPEDIDSLAAEITRLIRYYRPSAGDIKDIQPGGGKAYIVNENGAISVANYYDGFTEIQVWINTEEKIIFRCYGNEITYECTLANCPELDKGALQNMRNRADKILNIKSI